jgi:hypothetical protein
MDPSDRPIPIDPRELGRQFLELLDQVRAGSQLDIKDQELANTPPVLGQEGLFLVIDHEDVTVAVVRNEREFERVRVRRVIEVLAREIPRTMPPELQLALAGRRLREILPRFQMFRP